MKKLLFVLFLIVNTILFAKNWDAVYINKLIVNGNIDKVIQHYKDGYFGENRNPQDAFKIAELYVKKKDYASAMQWYDKEKQLINSSKVNLFNYANTNRLMGEYQKALDGYLMYAANTGDVAKVMDLANQVEKIIKLSSQSSNYKLDSYTFNTDADETNIAFLRTNAIYNTITINKDKKSYAINQVVRNFENFAEPVSAYKNNIPNLIITSLSYSKDGNTVVFSAIDEKPTSKKIINKNEKIYIAENLGGNFLNAKLLSFNSDGFSYKNPSLNNEATIIYFASNRAGTLGGFDIWKSNFENGKWTTPTNLGKLANTKADEINPFIVQDINQNTLYFSSDREGGFGGFDIYTVKKSNNIWQDAEMQPAPINSSADDVSIVYDKEVKTGYFSSNRNGGKGGFDVYRFTPFSIRIIINTIDAASNLPIDYAYAQLKENGNKAFEGVTNENGKAVFQVGKDRTFRINISKDNYKPTIVNASSVGKANGDSIELNVVMKQDSQFSVAKASTNSISLENNILFTGHIKDNATNKPAVATKMRMLNYATQKVREVDVDKDGKFEIILFLNNNYKVIFENESTKIIDELTTFGLEKNDVKLRDYLLTGTKFKLTENKVYKNGNLPSNLKIDNNKASNKAFSISTKNEPITKTKIDSLKYIISTNNSFKQKTNKTELAKTEIKKVETINKKAQTLVNTEPFKEIEFQKIEVDLENELAKKDKDSSTSTIERKKEKTHLAANIIATEKTEKIKVIKIDDEEIDVENEAVINAPKVDFNTEKNFAKEITKQKEEAIATPIKNVVEEKLKPIIEKTETKVEVSKQYAKQNVKEENEKAFEQKTSLKEVSEEVATTPAIAEKSLQTTITEEELPDVYYKIQLASYETNNKQFTEFENLGKVEIVKAYDKYVYRLGNFTELERAKQILDQARAKGYFVAFILQYNKNRVTNIIK